MTRGLFAYSLISICIIGMVTAAAAITRRALLAQGASAAAASAIVIALWLAPPVLSNSFLVFPEAFALLATASAVRVAFAEADLPVRGRVLWLAASLGLLPWLHRKYVFYAAALAARGAVAAPGPGRVARSPGPAPRCSRCSPRRCWVSRSGPGITGAISVDRWCWTAPRFRGEAFRPGVLGLLVDRENGLLVWAPVYLLLPAAWAVAGRRYAIWLLPAAYLFCISAGHDQWWGGFSPAARFLMPLVPIFAVGRRRRAAASAVPLWIADPAHPADLHLRRRLAAHPESLAAGRRPQSCALGSARAGWARARAGSRRCGRRRPRCAGRRSGSSPSAAINLVAWAAAVCLADSPAEALRGRCSAQTDSRTR